MNEAAKRDMGLALSYFKKKIDRLVDRKEDVIVVVDFQPTPLTTLSLLLEEKLNIFPGDIERLYLMAYDLKESCEYIKKTEYGRPVTIIGYADNDCSIDYPENVEAKRTPIRFAEHENLVKLKDGRFLLWYEPQHRGGKDFGQFYSGEIRDGFNDEDLSALKARLVKPNESTLNRIKHNFQNYGVENI